VWWIRKRAIGAVGVWFIYLEAKHGLKVTAISIVCKTLSRCRKAGKGIKQGLEVHKMKVSHGEVVFIFPVAFPL
jgi:hypothetical protein